MVWLSAASLVGIQAVSAMAADAVPHPSVIAPRALLGRIAGRVTTSGEPAEFAQVFVSRLKLGTLSDGTGGFTITSVPEGTQRVVVRLLGCAPDTHDVVVRAGET